MNNSCSILVQSLFNPCSILVQTLFNPCSNNQFEFQTKKFVSPKNESRFDETIHEHTWRGKRKERAEKTNNFERFFGDSTLTFLTFRNTYRLLILPTRRAVLLRGRERKIRGRQIKIRGTQILTGCAPKIPVFKGEVKQKGRSRGSSHISIQI